jgi:dTDP-glucose 4,6-dehydratase
MLSDLAPKLDGSRILLTGGTGFFGKWLTQALVSLPLKGTLDLVIVTRSRSVMERQPWLKNPRIQILELDLLDVTATQLLKAQAPFDFVIHAASPATFGEEGLSPESLYKTITHGIEVLLSSVRPRTKDSRLLCVSSGAVYPKASSNGPIAEESFDPRENQGIEPVLASFSDSYREGKREAERLCLRSHLGFKISIVRCFAFVGPYLALDQGFAVGNFIRDLLRGKSILVQGDGLSVRSYLYPTDLVNGLLRILVTPQKGAEIYNLGSDEGITIGDLARLIDESRSSPGPGVQIQGGTKESLSQNVYVPSISRMRVLLKFAPRVDIREAVRRTLKWHSLQS